MNTEDQAWMGRMDMEGDVTMSHPPETIEPPDHNSRYTVDLIQDADATAQHTLTG